jgi:hypothetical protein
MLGQDSGNGGMGEWGNGGIQLIPQNPKTLQLSN